MAESHDQRKQFLLHKAIEIYAQKGGVTVRELAEASGMNLASVNYYFGSKGNLISAVEHQLISEMNTAAMEAVSENEEASKDALKRVVRSLVVFLLKRPGFIRYFYKVLGNTGDDSYNLLAQVMNTEGEFIQLVCRYISHETGITDIYTLLCRYLMLLSSLVPAFVFGILDNDTILRLVELARGSGFSGAAVTDPSDVDSPVLSMYLDVVIDTVCSPICGA